jgi:hypothetical protein
MQWPWRQAMLAAVCFRQGWRGGLDYLATQHATVSASWGIFCVVLGTAGLYDPDRQERFGRVFAAAIVAMLGGTLLITALLWATWESARGVLFAFVILAFFAMLAIRLIHHLVWKGNPRELSLKTVPCSGPKSP